MREPKLLCLSFLPRIFMRQRAVYFYAYRNREFSTQTQIIQLSSTLGLPKFFGVSCFKLQT